MKTSSLALLLLIVGGMVSAQSPEHALRCEVVLLPTSSIDPRNVMKDLAERQVCVTTGPFLLSIGSVPPLIRFQLGERPGGVWDITAYYVDQSGSRPAIVVSPEIHENDSKGRPDVRIADVSSKLGKTFRDAVRTRDSIVTRELLAAVIGDERIDIRNMEVVRCSGSDDKCAVTSWPLGAWLRSSDFRIQTAGLTYTAHGTGNCDHYDPSESDPLVKRPVIEIVFDRPPIPNTAKLDGRVRFGAYVAPDGPCYAPVPVKSASLTRPKR
jgi:hypothetical protein